MRLRAHGRHRKSLPVAVRRGWTIRSGDIPGGPPIVMIRGETFERIFFNRGEGPESALILRTNNGTVHYRLTGERPDGWTQVAERVHL